MYINFELMIFLSNLPPNIYLVFLVKLFIIVKKTKLNKKQIRIIPRFAYINYKIQDAMFKFAVFNL